MKTDSLRRRLSWAEKHDASVKLCENDKMAELTSIISAMQEKERDGGIYDPSRKFAYQTGRQPQDDLFGTKVSPMVDENCRARMLEWSTKMIDYFDIDRSVVFVAAYYQDRYLATDAGKSAKSDRALYRVVSVTSLYLAIKIQVPHRWNITAHAFAQLCQGSVTGDEIDQMESNILFALDWNVNPPVPKEYCGLFLDLIFNSEYGQDCLLTTSANCDNGKDEASLRELKEHILELVNYQLEVAVNDLKLFQVRSSVLAVASILNALEGVVNESTPSDDRIELASFCQENIFFTLDVMKTCNIASATELEDTRTALLSSVVPSSERSEVADDLRSKLLSGCQMKKLEDSPFDSLHSVSASPKSTSKFWAPRDCDSVASKYVLTPQSVLSKVFAYHTYV